MDHKESPLTKKHEKDTKSINLDEINEIEEDIKLLEKCLFIDTAKIKSEEAKLCIRTGNDSLGNINSNISKYNIITKAKREIKIMSRDPATTPDDSKPPIYINKSTPEGNKIPQKHNSRRFIRKEAKVNAKSNSLQDLCQFNFNYRSLSPYHIQIARFNEYY